MLKMMHMKEKEKVNTNTPTIPCARIGASALLTGVVDDFTIHFRIRVHKVKMNAMVLRDRKKKGRSPGAHLRAYQGKD